MNKHGSNNKFMRIDYGWFFPENAASALGRILMKSSRSSREKYNVFIMAMPMMENEVI
jgi:hypothetical protein